MKPNARPLADLRISLSVSESDDSIDRGFPREQVNRVTVQLAGALLGQGASIVFGHDWREDGVMEAVHAFAQQVQAPTLSEPGTKHGNEPLLINVLPWPDAPHLATEELVGLSSTLRIETSDLPEDVSFQREKAIRLGRTSDLYKYVRARGLTHLRHRITGSTVARLCIGGRRSGSEGRYPGIVEEALLAVRDHKPLYLSGLLGGAALQLIEIIETGRVPDAFCTPTAIASLYVDPALAGPTTSVEDTKISASDVALTFMKLGLPNFAKANGLTVEENLEMFHAPAADDVIRLLLRGLARLKSRSIKATRSEDS